MNEYHICKPDGSIHEEIVSVSMNINTLHLAWDIHKETRLMFTWNIIL